MSIGEFALIDRFFARPAAQRDDVPVGIGDDGAVLAIAAEQRLVTTLATAAETAWNRSGGDAARIGNDVTAAALNRLAAAGARPAFVTLALTLPEADEPWLEAFSNALLAVAEKAGVALVGGDTTRGPFAATVVGHGLVPQRLATMHPRARPGDGIYMSGCLHANAATLPRPSTIRASLGAWIRARGGVAADLSEGLEAALAVLLRDRRLGTSVDLARLPCMAGAAEAAGGWPALARRHGHMELCFALDASLHGELNREAEALGTCITRFARVDDSGQRRLVAPNGNVLPPYMDVWGDHHGAAQP